MFIRYAEARGARLGSRKGDPTGKAVNVSAFAAELGIHERKPRRVKLATKGGRPKKGANPATLAGLASELGITPL